MKGHQNSIRVYAPPWIGFAVVGRVVMMAALMLMGIRTVAQSVGEYPLWPANETTAVAEPEQITYQPRGLDDRGFNRVVRNVTVPTLTVYRPVRPAHRGAALVVIPGGAYHGIVIDREGHAVARYFQAQGLTVGVLKYRLPQPDTFAAGLPAPQQDALEALRFMRRRAHDWNITTDRIGVLGASAGGHLAGSVAAFGRRADGSRPDFVALLYPVVTMLPPWAHEGSRVNLLGSEAAPQRLREFSLEHAVQAGWPPFFLTHARDDKTVPIENSEQLAAALSRCGGGVEFLPVATGGHGFSLWRGEPSAHWKDRFLNWLDELP